jgi:RNA polymerase sigma-70 factor (ECF subfamily)
VAQSARLQRETGWGETLSDAPDPNADPAAEVDQLQAVDHALHVVLQRLGAIERAAFVLRHAFDYPYERIADLARTSEANARQIVSRAGKRVADGRTRATAPHEHRRLAGAFHAARQGGLSPLEALLGTGET